MLSRHALGFDPRDLSTISQVAGPADLPDDVKALARPTLRHRIQLRPEAELEGVTQEAVLDGVLASVPVPR